MAATARFWDRIAERYQRSPIKDEESYRTKLAMTREHLRPDMDVLEFGCGTGSTALVHAPHVRHLEATDLSETMLAIARRKAAEAGVGNVTFLRSSAEAYDAPAESFDVVLALSLLHLLEDRDAVIAKAFRLLKPGGLFVSSTACLGDAMAWIRPVLPIGRMIGVFPYVRVFTGDDLVAAIERAGFSIERRFRPAPDKALFLIARKPGPALVR